MDKMYIYIGAGVLAVVVIIAVILMLKKKKSKNSGEPIHKDYDSSIANMVNNEPVKGGTFIPNDPVNPNTAPMPMPSVVEPQIDASGPDMMMNQPQQPMGPTLEVPNPMAAPVAPTLEMPNQMAAPVAPTLEVPNPMATPNPMNIPTGPELIMPTPMAPNPMDIPTGPELIMPTTMEMPAAVAPTPMAAPAVDPIMPNLSAPIMPSLTEAPAAPVVETPQPVAEPVAPIMPDLMAPPVETAPAAPTMEMPQPTAGIVPPVDLMAPPVDLMAPPTNVGMVAEPLIEQQPVAAPAPAPVEEPKFNVEIPVVDTPPMPEVAQIAAAPVMQNTEIPGPADNLNDSISGVTPTQPKKEPMFVFDMPEETKSTAPLHQEIEVDIPDMEEMV